MLSYPVKPMLLQSAETPFDSSDHIFEWKVDGIRCIAFFQNGHVRLQSKTGKNCTRQFPELWVLPVTADEIVLDGEITVLNQGRPNFEAVMERYMAGTKKISLLVKSNPAAFIVWDVLWYNGKSTMNLPLMKRKELLSQVLDLNNQVQIIDWVDTSGLALWAAIKEHGLEGMVGKRKNSRYIPGQRSSAWVKVKNYQKALVLL
jgi:ATP-dependent DNA ligase